MHKSASCGLINNLIPLYIWENKTFDYNSFVFFPRVAAQADYPHWPSLTSDANPVILFYKQAPNMKETSQFRKQLQRLLRVGLQGVKKAVSTELQWWQWINFLKITQLHWLWHPLLAHSYLVMELHNQSDFKY